MFITSLVLIGLIAIAVIAEQESAIAEQEELIAIPVKNEQQFYRQRILSNRYSSRYIKTLMAIAIGVFKF